MALKAKSVTVAIIALNIGCESVTYWPPV